MELVKGCYVRCKKTLKIGVVSSTANKFLYVEWLLPMEQSTTHSEIRHYLDYIGLSDVSELPIDQVPKGLESLRNKVLR